MTAQTIAISAIAVGLLSMVPLVAAAVRGNQPSKYLCLLLGAVLVSMWNVYQYTQTQRPTVLLDYHLDGTILVWGPAAYLFLRSILLPTSHNGLPNLLHFVPSAAVFLSQWPAFWFLSEEALASIRLGVVGLYYLQTTAYMYSGVRLLSRHPKLFAESRSSGLESSFLWLATFWSFFAVTLFADAMITTSSLIKTSGLSGFAIYYLSLEVALVVGIAAMLMLRTPSFSTLSVANVAAPSKSGTGLDQETMGVLKNALQKAMIEDKLYLTPGLRLDELADKTGQTTHLASEVLNKGFGKNFYEFVNGFRVRHAATLLEEHPAMTVTQAAFDAGFSNSVSFVKAFRGEFGLTPSEYRRQQRENLQT